MSAGCYRDRARRAQLSGLLMEEGRAGTNLACAHQDGVQLDLGSGARHDSKASKCGDDNFHRLQRGNTKMQG